MVADFFNVSVRNHVFLEVIYLTRIVPIFKSGDNTNPKNYRPISVLNFITKLFEKLMHKRLISSIAK